MRAVQIAAAISQLESEGGDFWQLNPLIGPKPPILRNNPAGAAVNRSTETLMEILLWPKTVKILMIDPSKTKKINSTKSGASLIFMDDFLSTLMYFFCAHAASCAARLSFSPPNREFLRQLTCCDVLLRMTILWGFFGTHHSWHPHKIGAVHPCWYL